MCVCVCVCVCVFAEILYVSSKKKLKKKTHEWTCDNNTHTYKTDEEIDVHGCNQCKRYFATDTSLRSHENSFHKRYENQKKTAKITHSHNSNNNGNNKRNDCNDNENENDDNNDNNNDDSDNNNSDDDDSNVMHVIEQDVDFEKERQTLPTKKVKKRYKFKSDANAQPVIVFGYDKIFITNKERDEMLMKAKLKKNESIIEQSNDSNGDSMCDDGEGDKENGGGGEKYDRNRMKGRKKDKNKNKTKEEMIVSRKVGKKIFKHKKHDLVDISQSPMIENSLHGNNNRNINNNGAHWLESEQSDQNSEQMMVDNTGYYCFPCFLFFFCFFWFVFFGLVFLVCLLFFECKYIVTFYTQIKFYTHKYRHFAKTKIAFFFFETQK